MPEHDDLIELAEHAVAHVTSSAMFNPSLRAERRKIAEAVIKVVREWDADLLKAVAPANAQGSAPNRHPLIVWNKGDTPISVYREVRIGKVEPGATAIFDTRLVAEFENMILGTSNPKKILGHKHDAAWCDEEDIK